MSVAFKTKAGRDAVHAAYRALLAEWPVPNEHLRIPTCHGETFVVACGPRGALPLVLLHGAQANTLAYMFDVAAWAQHFRVYAVDVLGEAGFSAEVRLPLSSDAHARWLDDVLDGLGLERALFVGTSFGGWLALDFATRRPHRVERLALMCPAGIGKQKNVLVTMLPLLFLGPWGVRKARELVLGKPPAVLTPLQQRFGAVMTLVGKHVRIRWVKFPRLSDADLARLPPTLAVLGGKDVLIDSFETKARLEAHCPHAKIHFLPEGRHFLPNQGEVVLEFLLADNHLKILESP